MAQYRGLSARKTSRGHIASKWCVVFEEKEIIFKRTKGVPISFRTAYRTNVKNDVPVGLDMAVEQMKCGGICCVYIPKEISGCLDTFQFVNRVV